MVSAYVFLIVIYVYLSLMVLYSFYFQCLAGYGEPDGGTLSLCRFEVDGALHPLYQFVADAQSETCVIVGSGDEALEDVRNGGLRYAATSVLY